MQLTEMTDYSRIAENSETMCPKISAQVGSRLLLEVGQRFPAVASAQGAAISLFCRTEGIDSEGLKHAIMRDGNELQRLVDTVNIHHLKIHAPQVGMKSVFNVITDDFYYAKAMSVFSLQEVQAVMGLYSIVLRLTSPEETRHDRLVAVRTEVNGFADRLIEDYTNKK